MLPIVKTVVEEFIFTTDTTPIKDIIYIQRNNKNIQKQQNAPGQPLRLDPDEAIKVEYSTSPDTTRMDNDKNAKDYLPIYENKKLGVSLTPMHAHTILEMTISYRSQSYDDLVLWIANYARNTMRAAPSHTHGIAYNITIPDEVCTHLHDVWGLTETVEPYGNTFKDFLLDGFKAGLGIRANSNDSVQKLFVAVKKNNCTGVYTTPPPDVPVTQLDPPISEITFTYTIYFEQPTALVLDYQHVIHNNKLDLSILYPYAERVIADNPMCSRKTHASTVFDLVDHVANVPLYPERVVNETDGWQPSVVPDGYNVVNILPLQLDLNNQHLVINLYDLLPLGYERWLLEEMFKCGDLLYKTLKWFFLFEVFEVDDVTNKVLLKTDVETKDILSVYQMKPRCRHYLVIYKNFKLGNMDFTGYRKIPDTLENLFSLTTDIPLGTIGSGTYATTAGILTCVNDILTKLRDPYQPPYQPYTRLVEATFSNIILRNQN
jgi:hypothetical protein